MHSTTHYVLRIIFYTVKLTVNFVFCGHISLSNTMKKQVCKQCLRRLTGLFVLCHLARSQESKYLPLSLTYVRAYVLCELTHSHMIHQNWWCKLWPILPYRAGTPADHRAYVRMQQHQQCSAVARLNPSRTGLAIGAWIVWNVSTELNQVKLCNNCVINQHTINECVAHTSFLHRKWFRAYSGYFKWLYV